MRCREREFAVAQYARLSREDGDHVESDSIINQQRVIQDYCMEHPEFQIMGTYVDDGFSGINFARPDFQRMMCDIEKGRINCVIVKDLSRFGRDYIDMGYYLERIFPRKGVRFIAINDGVDSESGYDMLLPLKNVLNTQYAKDISQKVRSALAAKQRRGEFIGAFAAYGYRKNPANHNQLLIDPVAAQVVRRIFQMAAEGVGQLKIAKILNEEGIPCPSLYKRLMGERYCNKKRLNHTTYWTYATIHRMIHNELYLGTMVQHRSVRVDMCSKAKAEQPERWIVVPNTHEGIISQALWDAVQNQTKVAYPVHFTDHRGLFSGFLRCGDCGRAMVKTNFGGQIRYSCGSYRRYGAGVCSGHTVRQDELCGIILDDLNRMFDSVSREELRSFVQAAQAEAEQIPQIQEEIARLSCALVRVQQIKQRMYEDYQEGVLSREEFMRYKADYDRQEQVLFKELERRERQEIGDATEKPEAWHQRLLRTGTLTELDRLTLTQTVKEIQVFEPNRIEITYLFSQDTK